MSTGGLFEFLVSHWMARMEGSAALGWKLLGIATVAAGVHLLRRWRLQRASGRRGQGRVADEGGEREPLLPAAAPADPAPLPRGPQPGSPQVGQQSAHALAPEGPLDAAAPGSSDISTPTEADQAPALELGESHDAAKPVSSGGVASSSAAAETEAGTAPLDAPSIALFSRFAPPPALMTAPPPHGAAPPHDQQVAAAWSSAGPFPTEQPTPQQPGRGLGSSAEQPSPQSSLFLSSPGEGGELTAAQALFAAAAAMPHGDTLPTPAQHMHNPFAATQLEHAEGALDPWAGILGAQMDQADSALDPWAGILGAAAAAAAASSADALHTHRAAPAVERSATLRSSSSDRRLPRVEEEEGIESVRSSADVDVRLALKLDVIAGPCSETSYVTGDDTLEVSVGRAPDNVLVLPDGEVSGRHALIAWSSAARCWQVADLGSLNGTLLNGEPIGGRERQRGGEYRLSTDDILQLGTASRLKVSVFPREMLPENRLSGEHSARLSFGSLPRSLTMPKHRIPSFTSLLSPKINSSPTKRAVVAAASDELRLECCIASKTGRDHARKGQPCEDVACAECPLHGSEAAPCASPAHAALFCVFDGHCGRGAADAASVALPDEVSDRLAAARGALAAGESVAGLLRDAFLATDERIASEEGCTATAILAWRAADGGVHLQAANVGDSSALLIDPGDGSWRELTEDHRLTNPRERERLAGTGIPLSATTRRLYGLNLARALGDRFLKDEDLGLSAEPTVGEVVRLPRDAGALVLVASDGLWDVADFERAVAVAVAADRERGGSVVEVAHAVVAAAKKAGTRDDVTVLAVRVWPEADWARRSPTHSRDDGRRSFGEHQAEAD